LTLLLTREDALVAKNGKFDKSRSAHIKIP
jgi:hypothetical protein